MSLVDQLYRLDGRSSLAWMRHIRDTMNQRIGDRAERLAKHLDWCQRSVSFYRNRIPESGDAFERLAQIPVFPKESFSANRDDFLPDCSIRGVKWDCTGGTSGKTFRFPISRRERCLRRGYELLANSLLGFEPGARHLVLWGGHESRSMSNRITVKLFDLLARRELLTVSGVDSRQVSRLLPALEKHAGGVLISYPSILLNLCDFGCDPILRSYRSIILTAEGASLKQFEQFNLRNLRNRYGTREFGAIACGLGQELFYFADRFILEHDDAAGILVTDLERHSLPMLRYPVGDFAPQLSEMRPSWEGLPSLGEIMGRTMDQVVGLSGRAYIGTFWPLMLRRLGVERFRVHQDEPGRILIRYVGTESPDSLHPKLIIELKNDFNLKLKRVDEIPELLNAKQRIVEIGTPDPDHAH